LDAAAKGGSLESELFLSSFSVFWAGFSNLGSAFQLRAFRSAGPKVPGSRDLKGWNFCLVKKFRSIETFGVIVYFGTIMNRFRYGSRIHLKGVLSHFLTVGVLSALGLLSGLAPGLSGRLPVLVTGDTARAQTITDAELVNYARAVLAIEPKRQAAYEEIKEKSGSVPAIVCSDSASINKLPGNVRNIAVNFCNQSKAIVEKNGLNIARFNEITTLQQNDSALQKRIQDEILRQQKSSASS
jgi:hypothetical protein